MYGGWCLPRSSKPFAGRCEASWVGSIPIHPRQTFWRFHGRPPSIGSRLRPTIAGFGRLSWFDEPFKNYEDHIQFQVQPTSAFEWRAGMDDGGQGVTPAIRLFVQLITFRGRVYLSGQINWYSAGGQGVEITTDPSYTGPVLVRIKRLDGTGMVTISGPGQTLADDAFSIPESSSPPYWGVWLGGTTPSAPGCYTAFSSPA